MENKSNKFINALKAFEWGYAALFAVLVALGVLSFCFHDMLKWVVFAAGAIIAAFGVGYGIYTLLSKTRGARFVIRIIIFASAIVAGVITMIFHAHGVEVLTSVLGTLFIIDGACKLQKTSLLIRYRSVAWWMLIVPALLSVAGGFMLIKWGVITDESSTVFVAVLLGVTAIVDAISNILTPFLAPVLKKQDGDGSPDEAACETESEAENTDTGTAVCENDAEAAEIAEAAVVAEAAEAAVVAEAAEAAEAAVVEKATETAETSEEDAATENTDDDTAAEKDAQATADDADAIPTEIADADNSQTDAASAENADDADAIPTEIADADNIQTDAASAESADDAPSTEEGAELVTQIDSDATESEVKDAADTAEAESASATVTDPDKPRDE